MTIPVDGTDDTNSSQRAEDDYNSQRADDDD